MTECHKYDKYGKYDDCNHIASNDFGSYDTAQYEILRHDIISQYAI